MISRGSNDVFATDYYLEIILKKERKEGLILLLSALFFLFFGSFQFAKHNFLKYLILLQFLAGFFHPADPNRSGQQLLPFLDHREYRCILLFFLIPYLVESYQLHRLILILIHQSN